MGEPPAKRLRLDLGGQGIQNANGNVSIGRDINIINNGPNRSREDDKYQVLLESLRFDQMDARQLSIKKAHAQTCRWFLNTSLYTKWTPKDPPYKGHNFLWIKGKPGAGKSTLMKFLLRQLRNQIRQAKNQEILVSFFFNARGHDLEKTTTGLYRSLLLQLLEARPHLLYILDDVRVGQRWTIEFLKSLFEEAVQGLDDTSVVCLIDALDECEEAQVRDMVSFLSDLSIARDRLHICFASRHYPHITVEIGLSIVLEEQVGHSKDIASYLSSALRIGHSDLAEQIRYDLQEKASGVFMWVVLVVDILNKEYDAGHGHVLRSRIQQLPKDLHDLFHEILTRNGQTTNGLLLCIQWVLFAQQPLTPKELYFAIISGLEPHHLARCHSDEISEDTIKKYILDSSKGLAESTKSKIPTIQFIHESVRDFLLKEEGLSKIWPDLSVSLLGPSHNALKHCCLTYMNMEAVTVLKESSHEAITERFPFLEYTNRGVLYHAEQAQNHDISQRDFLAILPRSRWVEHHNIFQKHKARQYTPKVSLLYILAEAGMPTLIRAQADRQSCFKVENERYGPPILAASATKSGAAIQAMLELEAERLPEFSFADFCSQWPPGLDILHVSGRNFVFKKTRELFPQLVEYGNEKASLFFLATEYCNIHLQDKHGKTVLMRAAENGFSVLVEVLLQKGVDISVADNEGNTPLHWGSEKGRTEVVKVLIDRGADVSATDRYGRTPLHEASFQWVSSTHHVETVKLLIDCGANISAVDKNGETSLHKALSSNNKKIAKLLIDYGADISAVDKDGETPLHKVSTDRNVETAKLLIDHGANVSAADRYGQTPLHQAAGRKYSSTTHVKTVKLLIDHGANISAVDENGETPLHRASSPWVSSTNHVETVKLFIDHGADVSAADKNGKTPLHGASSRSINIELAKLLIDHGANVSAIDKDGETPLHSASSTHENIEVAKLFIDCGANISAVNKDGKTPLHKASSSNNKKIAKLLIDYGADISAVDKDGSTPLHSASSSSRNSDVAGLLIDRGADVSAVDKDGKTPLHWASASYGSITEVKLLIERGADISAADNDGKTPLHWASSLSYNTEVAKLLIDRGADISAVNKYGKTPLYGAPMDMTQLLIEHGADVSVADKDEMTPLH